MDLARVWATQFVIVLWKSERYANVAHFATVKADEQRQLRHLSSKAFRDLSTTVLKFVYWRVPVVEVGSMIQRC